MNFRFHDIAGRCRAGGSALWIVGLAALLAIVSTGVSCSKRPPTSPLAFGHRAVPTSTNADFVWVTITNQSRVGVYYLAKPLQVKSNGIWSGPPGPPRQRLMKLPGGQSGVLVIEAAATNENSRVPVLWGYDNYTPGAPRWQQLAEGLVASVSGRGGRGFLYTNYLSGVTTTQDWDRKQKVASGRY